MAAFTVLNMKADRLVTLPVQLPLELWVKILHEVVMESNENVEGLYITSIGHFIQVGL